MPPEKAIVSAMNEEGEIYVGQNGLYYTKPQIDVDKIKDTLNNNYIVEQISKLRSILFPDRCIVKVLNPKGEEDKELSVAMNLMVSRPEVSLNSIAQQVWTDVFSWGSCLLNPVWEKVENIYTLMKLRRLPPETFYQLPQNYESKIYKMYNEILQGITKDDSNEQMVYFQTLEYGKPMMLRNIVMITDPIDTVLGGESDIIPIVPIISMLDFCHTAQMQYVNRAGAPIVFIKITNPQYVPNKRDDIEYANKILQNWGKGTAYVLRENMELIKLDLSSNMSALETIQSLENRIHEYFNPSAMLKKEGSTLGGNAVSQSQMVYEWVKGVHRWLGEQLSRLLQPYLDNNAYADYTVQVIIPEPTPDRSDLKMQQARIGWDTQSLTINEIREKLELPPLTPEQINAIAEERKLFASQVQPPAFGFQTKTEAKQIRSLDDELNEIEDKFEKRVQKAMKHEDRTST